MQVTVQDGVDSPTCYYNYCTVMYVDNSSWIYVHWLLRVGSSICSKMTYYAIPQCSQRLPIMLLTLTIISYYALKKKFNEIYYTAQNSCFQSSQYVLIHRPFSTTLQQINKDITLFLLSEKLILFHYSH